MHRTNIELDEALVKEAMRLTRKTTKKAVVHFALEELVNKVKRQQMLAAEGKVPWEGSLDEMRRARH